ncbi:hypothetical protein MRO13_16060 [Vibrio metschnikovii]|nr:hypothetical protein [Vibrio sp. A11]EKO3678061.1 hypothetical protein [Vibrio metschnikovii]NNN62429.1 hypothetical protein [Vibrio sp. A11]
MDKRNYYKFAYDHLLAIYPDKPWVKIISKMSGKNGKALAINKFGERMIAFGLFLWETKPFEKCDSYEKGAIAEALFYSGKFLEYLETLPDVTRNGLKSRFGSALKESDDMRALMFEVFSYFYLVDKGYVVESKDLDGSNETFDYLATSGGEVQVECKSFAYDKGLFITSDEAQVLLRLILEKGLKVKQPPQSALTCVELEMLSGFPKSKSGQKTLLEEVDAVISGRSNDSELFKVGIKTFANLDNIEKEEVWENIKFESGGIELAFAVSAVNGKDSRHALSISTTFKPALLREFENICKDASRRQFKESKAGSLFIHIPHIETYKGLNLSDRFSGKIKNIFSRPHLSNIVLFSNLGVVETQTYPYFEIHPLIKEYQNTDSELEGISI